jgi:hypothetical protein
MSQRWIGSPRRDGAKLIAEAADHQAAKPHDCNALSRIRQAYAEPGDNAFHLALGTLVREYFRTSNNEFIRSRFTD